MKEVWLRRIGIALSSLIAIAMLADGVTGLLRPDLFAGEMASDGWPARTLMPVALLALVSGALYAFPRTAVLGAIFITGFVGGALATHLRVSEAVVAPEVINVLLGVGAWGGLWLRDPRLRLLLPFR